MIKKENILSMDSVVKDNKNIFSITLSANTGLNWKAEGLPSHNPHRSHINELIRYVKYIKVGFNLFKRRKVISNIVAWQQFHGIFFAFFCHLFFVKKTSNLIILTFIYKRKKGFIGSIYEKFMRFAMYDKYIDAVICFSEQEIKQYQGIFGIKKDKYHFMKVAADKITEIDFSPEPSKYIFSAGYSHRDFNFLINSIKSTSYHLVIADDMVSDPNEDNITIVRKCYGDEMRKLLGKSYVFIIPLKDKTISAGHLMSIAAMNLHKPIICTKSAGMRPYVVEGRTGYFIENTKEDLLSKLDLLYKNTDLYKSMSEESYHYGEKQFSWTRLAKDIAYLGKKGKLFL